MLNSFKCVKLISVINRRYLNSATRETKPINDLITIMHLIFIFHQINVTVYFINYIQNKQVSTFIRVCVGSCGRILEYVGRILFEST